MALFAHFRSNDIILTQRPDPIESHQGKWSAWMAVVGTDHCVAIHTWWHESGQSAINHVHIGIADEIKSIQLLLITPEKIEKKPEITDSARIVVIYLDIQKTLQEWVYDVAKAINKAPAWNKAWLTKKWLDIPLRDFQPENKTKMSKPNL